MKDPTEPYWPIERGIGCNNMGQSIGPIHGRVPAGFEATMAKWLNHAYYKGCELGAKREREKLREQITTVDDIDVDSVNGNYGVYFDNKLVITARTLWGANRLARKFHKAKLAALTPTEGER